VTRKGQRHLNSEVGIWNAENEVATVRFWIEPAKAIVDGLIS